MRYVRQMFCAWGGVLLGLIFAELMGWQRGASLLSAHGADWPTAIAVGVGAGLGIWICDQPDRRP